MSTYPKHFLKHVVCQINYGAIPSLKTHIDSTLRETLTKLTGTPIVENKSQTFSVTNNQPVTTEFTSFWATVGNGLQITLQFNQLQIINSKYTDYTHFHGIVMDVHNKLKEVYNTIPIRVSLRYVNQININEGPTFDFDNLINRNLLLPTLSFQSQGLTRSLGSMIMIDDIDQLSTTFSYGFYNSQFPNKIAKREYLLDYDCSTIAKNDPLYFDNILQILSKIRLKVNDLFDKSIEQGLKDKMK